jgi:hypothetical protein
MADGCYDLNGKCTVCGHMHPCECENMARAEDMMLEEARERTLPCIQACDYLTSGGEE